MEEEKERMRRNSGKIYNKNVNIRNFRVVHTLDFSPFLKNFLTAPYAMWGRSSLNRDEI